MKLLIVSGLSGSGKSVSMNALEDIGYSVWTIFLPGCCPRLWPFPGLATASWTGWPSRWMWRGCRSQEEIREALAQLDLQQTPYKILFLDSSDDVLCRRYKETRRRHPISQAEDIPTKEALARNGRFCSPCWTGRLCD